MKRKITVEQFFCFYAFTLCFAFFAYIVIQSYITKFPLPQETGMIMTAVISIATGIVGYMIGSNAQSKNKDEMIKQAMETIPANAIPATANTSTLTLNWRGSLDVTPTNPAINDAYIDTTQNKNFYWNGTNWIETTQKPA